MPLFSTRTAAYLPKVLEKACELNLLRPEEVCVVLPHEALVNDAGGVTVGPGDSFVRFRVSSFCDILELRVQ